MKKILYVLIALIAVYLILCLFGKSESKVERSLDINMAPEPLKTKITDLKFFHHVWSPWTEKDPAMKVTYTGETGVPGNKMAWVSGVKEVGKGSMTYNYNNGDTIAYTLHFDDFGDSKVYHTVIANGTGSKVTWGMYSEAPFMFRGMMLFMNVDAMVGPDFEKGLSKLKAAVESMPAETASANYEVKELTWEAKTYYGKRTKMAAAEMPAFFGKTYGDVGAALAKAKLEPIGMPKAIYFEFNEKTMVADFAPVMEVANGTKLSGVDKFETPAGKVLLIEYFGDYNKSMNAHFAMDAYMKEKGLKQILMVEDYMNDPMAEKDTAKWQTNIYYLVK